MRRARRSRFPISDLDACRHASRLQAEQASIVAKIRQAHAADTRCPECGASGDRLVWFYFSSPQWTWERLCGRAGVVAYCETDETQVAFFLTVMN